MKLKFKHSFLIITLIFQFAISDLFAQKFGTPILGAGRSVMYTKFIGLLGNKEIRSNVTNGGFKYNYNLLIYEDGKKLDKESIQVSYNGVKYVPDGYFIKGKKIVGYFIAGKKSTETVMLCLQEFDDKLVQTGSPIELIELPKAVDPATLMDVKSGGMFKDKVIKEQDLTAKYDNTTGTTLFTFSLQLTESYNTSYAKIVLIDSDYNILNSYEHQAATSEHYIKAVPLAIYENDDALVSISEGKIETNSSVFNISEQFLMHVPSNGNTPKELELMPDQQRILKSVASENIDANGNIVYAIQSFVRDPSQGIDKAFIGVYTYDAKQGKLDRFSIGYDKKDFFDNKRIDAGTFKLKKVINLPDGSMLFWLEGNWFEKSLGDLIIKLDKNKEFLWAAKSRHEVAGYPGETSAVDYIDEEGNLNLVFNYHPKLFKDNKLIPKVGNVGLGSIPIKAIINIETGNVRYEKLNGGNLTLGGILISDSQNLGENGKYLMHMMVNKKLQFIEVDFNAR